MHQCRSSPTPIYIHAIITPGDSVPRSPRSLLILPQFHEKLPKLFLATARRSPLGPLPTQIHQLPDPLPARTPCAGILTVGEEVLGFFAGPGDGFILFAVVIFVEVVDVSLGFGDPVGFFGRGRFFALGDVGVAF